MNQQKVGLFLKELRCQRALTQEQLSSILGVSNRSISRWENGVTMPDFDLLIQIAKFYDVEIGEILDGERKIADMDKQSEETFLKIADYNNKEKETYSKKLHYICIAGLVGMVIYMVIDLMRLSQVQPYRSIINMVLGLVIGALLTGALYTSRHLMGLKAAKARLLKRDAKGEK